MNTVGKILVILNFLFAIIVGALLVMDVAMRNQWKQAYNDLKNDATILKAGRDADIVGTRKIIADYAQNKLLLEDLKEKDAKAKSLRDAMVDAHDVEMQNMLNKLDANLVTVNETAKAKQRLVDEIAELTKNIKSRETLIVKLETNIKVIRIQAQKFETDWRTAQTRNENIMAELQAVTKALALKDAGVNPDRVIIKNPNDPNPPAVVVNGKVEKVEGGDLMLITLGTDHGVNKNNTLDIYRLHPEPKYLGTIRIVDANHHKSVARLIPSGNAAFRPVLREGDLVTSKLPR